MANCLWNDFEGHRKLHLANWKQMFARKKSLGILESLTWEMLPCVYWAHGLKGTSRMMVKSGKTL
jgi:hypothetical protein